MKRENSNTCCVKLDYTAYILYHKSMEEKRHPLLKILFFDVSTLIGGAFVALLIFAAIFGVLNYFNIISLSAFYRPLSILPHKTVKQTNLVPPPTNYTPNVFQYDVKKAEKLLTQYIKDTIKPDFLPEKITINQGQQIDGKKSNLSYEFGWYDQINSASLGANLHFAENTNTIADKEIFIEISNNNLAESSMTASLANSLLSPYLKVQEQIQSSDCKSKLNTSYCQVFKQDTNGKNGFGIIMLSKGALPVIQNPHLILFSCSLSKEGNLYKTQQSCLRGF